MANAKDTEIHDETTDDETVIDDLEPFKKMVQEQYPKLEACYEESLEKGAINLLENLENSNFVIYPGFNYFLLNRSETKFDLRKDYFANKLFSAKGQYYCIVGSEEHVLFVFFASEEPLNPIYVVMSIRKINGFGPLSYSGLLQDMALNAAIALNDNENYHDSKAYHCQVVRGNSMLVNLLSLLNLRKELIKDTKKCELFGMSQYEEHFVLIMDKRSSKCVKHHKLYLTTFQWYGSQIQYDQLLERYATEYWNQFKHNRYNLPLLIDCFVCGTASSTSKLTDAINAEREGAKILARMPKYTSFGAANFKNHIVFVFMRSKSSPLSYNIPGFEGLQFDCFFQNFRHAKEGDYLENDPNLNVQAQQIALKLSEEEEITETVKYIFIKSDIEPKNYIADRRIFGLLLDKSDKLEDFLKYNRYGFGRCFKYFVVTFEGEKSKEKEKSKIHSSTFSLNPATSETSLHHIDKEEDSLQAIMRCECPGSEKKDEDSEQKHPQNPEEYQESWI